MNQRLAGAARRLRRMVRKAMGYARPKPSRRTGTYAVDMDAYWRSLDESLAAISNSFAWYERLVDHVAHMPAASVLPLYELMRPIPEGERVFGFRHDVDADPLTALRAARALARVGVCGSFYLLHTAAWYGTLQDGVLARNPMMREWLDGFIVAGAEVGLHTDAMGLAMLGQPVASLAVRDEIEWLRSMGVVVRGTVAHNTMASHGAENYEVFRERVLWPRRTAAPNGEPLPIGALSEKSLELTYEGTFATAREPIDHEATRRFIERIGEADVRSEAWMRWYLLDNPYCRWGPDYQLWLVGRDQWVAAGRSEGDADYRFGLTWVQAFDWLYDRPAGTRTVLVIHPGYVRGV